MFIYLRGPSVVTVNCEPQKSWGILQSNQILQSDVKLWLSRVTSLPYFCSHQKCLNKPEDMGGVWACTRNLLFIYLFILYLKINSKRWQHYLTFDQNISPTVSQKTNDAAIPDCSCTTAQTRLVWVTGARWLRIMYISTASVQQTQPYIYAIFFVGVNCSAPSHPAAPTPSPATHWPSTSITEN